MPDKKVQLEAFLQFIKERRSDESYFEEVYNKLEEISQSAGDNQQEGTNYISNLTDVKERQAEEYRKAKEVSGTAWPEYEKFITQIERSVIEAIRE